MKKRLVALVFVMLATLLHASSLAQTESRKIRLVSREVSLGKVHPGIVEESLLGSPDSNRFAYVVERGGKQLVMLDGVEGKKYDGIEYLLFSPDGNRLAYVAKRGSKRLVVVDGEEGKEYDEIKKEEGATPIFSLDSKRVAYKAKRGGKWLVVVDGKEGEEYDGIGSPTPDSVTPAGVLFGAPFSPDSKRLAYSAYSAERGGKRFVMVDGVEGSEYDKFFSGGFLTFSPDSKRVAYAVEHGGKRLVVVDGEDGKGYYWIGSALTFSPDSKRMAYVAALGGDMFVVVDGVEGKVYDDFLRGSVAVDFVEEMGYERGSKLVFDSPNLLHALAWRGMEIFRVEVEIVEE